MPNCAGFIKFAVLQQHGKLREGNTFAFLSAKSLLWEGRTTFSPPSLKAKELVGLQMMEINISTDTLLFPPLVLHSMRFLCGNKVIWL